MFRTWPSCQRIEQRCGTSQTPLTLTSEPSAFNCWESATYVESTAYSFFASYHCWICLTSQSLAKDMWLSVRRQNSASRGSMSASCERAQVGPLASSEWKRLMKTWSPRGHGAVSSRPSFWRASAQYVS